MSRWPWITTVAAGIVLATPIAHEVFKAAFISSERWMQDFWRFVFVCGVAIAVVLGLIEWGVRVMIIRRRDRA
ncbi:MAG TPA: hypothetical protein VGH49_03590, partial [Xanthobacteraceae bacterium]